MNITYKIQPLRITGGWSVEFNSFYECDPETCTELWSYFNEDLLQLKNRQFGFLIDLGWYPDGDIKGSYKLYLFYGDFRGTLLEVFESRDKNEIVKKIELWTDYDFYKQYI